MTANERKEQGNLIQYFEGRLDQLQAENARLRAALEQYADERNWVETGFTWAQAVERGCTLARRALGREESRG